MTVGEMSRKYIQLLSAGTIIGFNVLEKEGYIEWNYKNNHFFLIPFADEFIIPTELDSVSDKIILVDISDTLHDVPAKYYITSLEDITELSSNVEREVITSQSAINIWNSLFVHHENKVEPLTEANKEKMIIDTAVSFSTNEKKKEKLSRLSDSSPGMFIDLINLKTGNNFEYTKKKMFVDHKKDAIVLQLVSKVYPRTKFDEYWYSIHAYQIEEMRKYRTGFYSFGFQNQKRLVLIEKNTLCKLLPILTSSPNNGDKYWHIKINTNSKGDFYFLKTIKGVTDIDILSSEGFLVVYEKEDFVDLKVNTPQMNEKKINRIRISDSMSLREVHVKGKTKG